MPLSRATAASMGNCGTSSHPLYYTELLLPQPTSGVKRLRPTLIFSRASITVFVTHVRKQHCVKTKLHLHFFPWYDHCFDTSVMDY